MFFKTQGFIIASYKKGVKRIGMDNFDKWNDTKKAIHNSPKRQKIIKEGGVYWVNVGQNVGCEVNGKGGDFVRPVLVLKKVYIENTTYDFFIGVLLLAKTKKAFYTKK
ncbi:hypothetical protein [Helicobacter sp. CLO-3]|uniref:hypothetical protein n=1 Tax=Helicobacter sp. CLO-3 TaxID=211 RepID=UPI0020A359BE|nr:hypothetical protein [Helicobacter sp. CLO-3]